MSDMSVLSDLSLLSVPCVPVVLSVPMTMMTIMIMTMLKKALFMVRLTIRGGEGQPSLLDLTISKCEKFDPFFLSPHGGRVPRSPR